MELTTNQIYALAGIIVFAIVAIGIAYCAGLHTGNASGWAAGRQAGSDHWRPLYDEKRRLAAREVRLRLESEETREYVRTKLAEARAELKARNATLIELEAAPILTEEDRLTLLLAARQLGIASHQFIKRGSGKTNQYALAQSRIQQLTERLSTPPSLLQNSLPPVAGNTSQGGPCDGEKLSGWSMVDMTYDGPGQPMCM